MVNAMIEALTDKTKDQYKIIEERYEILKRYLKEFFEQHYQMTAADVKVILAAIEPQGEAEKNAALLEGALKALSEDEENETEDPESES